MIRLAEKIKNYLELEFENAFLWAPVAMGLGILFYFRLPLDPSFTLVVMMLAAAIGCFLLCRNKFYLSYLSFAFLLFAIGFAASDYRTHSVSAPKLNEEKKEIWLEGKVDEIIFYDKGKKLVLSEIESLDLLSYEIPEKIRINVKSDINEILIGDVISIKATLMPPPKPSIPGGFEFERFLYFKQIGAIGFALSKPRVIENSVGVSLRDRVNSLRKKIADRIESQMSYPANAIAIAMLVGDTSRIKSAEFEQIRKSGIAHLIAISGLHIVTVVAIIFLLTRFLITQSTYLSNRFNSKKIAAIVSILCTSIYLVISGAPVSAQRAFIMSCIVLIAILADRSSSPMRSIAISAMLILLITPEALLSASLQMSFTACIALVASFNYFEGIFVKKTDPIKKKAIGYFFGVCFSTLIAGTATAPLVIYHFNQFSTYSLLANLICVPLSDFIIMPFGILMLVLMPLGLDFLPAFIIENGLSIVANTAEHVSQLPYSSFFIPSFPDYGIFLVISGFLTFCFMKTNIKFAGIPILFAGLFTQMSFAPPDILIDSQAKLFAYINDKNEMYVSSKQKSRFSAKSWQAALGANKLEHVRKLKNCSEKECVLNIKNHKVLIGNKLGDVKNFDVVINTSDNNIKCDDNCINWNKYKALGAATIKILDGEIKMESVGQKLIERIWNK